MSKPVVDLAGGAQLRRFQRHTDEQLLDAALAVFAADGYQAATVDAIATRAGSTKPTLYARFGSKLDLYERTIAREAELLTARLFAGGDGSGGEALEPLIGAVMDAWFTYVAERPDGLRLLLSPDRGGPSAPVADAAISSLVGEVDRFIQQSLARGRGGAPRVTALLGAMIIGTAVQAASRLADDPGLDARATARLTTVFVLAALRGIDPGLLARR